MRDFPTDLLERLAEYLVRKHPEPKIAVEVLAIEEARNVYAFQRGQASVSSELLETVRVMRREGRDGSKYPAV